MAWKRPEERPENTDVVSPHEFNANIAALFAEFNGLLDSDNLGNGIVHDNECANEAWNSYRYIMSDTARAFTKSPNVDDTGWLIFNDSTEQIALTATDGTPSDGMLDIDFNCSFQVVTSDASRSFVGFAILVDNAVVAMTDSNAINDSTQTAEYQIDYVCAQVPVAAGAHTIRWAVRIRNDGTGTGTLTVNSHFLGVCACKR